VICCCVKLMSITTKYWGKLACTNSWLAWV
jgi:hypothetical protein